MLDLKFGGKIANSNFLVKSLMHPILNVPNLNFRCSERSFDFAALREILPSRCTLGLDFCKGTCQAIGRKTGSCEYGKGCECSDEHLTPSEFALCAAESTCRLDCQANGKGNGKCNGWKCECQSKTGDSTTEYIDDTDQVDVRDETINRDVLDILSEETEDFSQ